MKMKLSIETPMVVLTAGNVEVEAFENRDKTNLMTLFTFGCVVSCCKEQII